MRATNLQFRSPKEYTPTAYDVRVTKDGSSLQYLKKPISAQGTFSKEGRFSLFKQLANRMPSEVGPGSYYYRNGSIEKSVQEKGTISYKKLHQKNIDGNDGAFLVGSLMVYEQRLSSRRQRAPEISPPPRPHSTQTVETTSIPVRVSDPSEYTTSPLTLPSSTDHHTASAKLPHLKPKSIHRSLSKGKVSGIPLDLRRLLCYTSSKPKRRKSKKLSGSAKTIKQRL
jgi:hypothetical protein